MNHPQTSQSASPTLQQRQDLSAWVDLRDQLAELNARLEYVKLLLKVGSKPL